MIGDGQFAHAHLGMCKRTPRHTAHHPPMHPLHARQIFTNPWLLPMPYNWALFLGSLLLNHRQIAVTKFSANQMFLVAGCLKSDSHCLYYVVRDSCSRFIKIIWKTSSHLTFMLSLWTLRSFKVPVTRDKVVKVWVIKNLCLIT